MALLAALLPVLNACNWFSPQNPVSESCYTNPPAASAQPAFDDKLGEDAGVGAYGAYSAYVPGRLLVSYRGGVGPGDLTKAEGGGPTALGAARSIRQRYDLTTLSRLSASDLESAHSVDPTGDYLSEVVRVPDGADIPALAAELERDPRVRYAEPDYYLRPLGTPDPDLPDPGLPDPDLPNDPDLFEQWHLLGFGLPEAWALETGKPGVVLAVLDSGVDLTHEDLRGRTLPGCDIFNGDNDPSPGSPAQLGENQRHGTHVAGIALASGDNGRGVASVAYSGVRLLPVKVFNDNGSQLTSTSVVANAIRWSAGLSVEGLNRTPYPARIINLSLGGAGNVQTLDDAVRDARNAGSLVVAASGNGSSSEAIFTPANAPGALAVGAVDADYTRSDFSNYSAAGRTVDLMAPGGFGENSCGAVYSTVSPAFEGEADTYGCERGTSMASPFVAGVAALIWSQNPDLTDDEVEAQLLSSTRYTPAMNRAEYGAGVVCADRALGAATLCGE